MAGARDSCMSKNSQFNILKVFQKKFQEKVQQKEWTIFGKFPRGVISDPKIPQCRKKF